MLGSLDCFTYVDKKDNLKRRHLPQTNRVDVGYRKRLTNNSNIKEQLEVNHSWRLQHLCALLGPQD